VVQLTDDALLLASDAVSNEDLVHRQVLNGSDWIHVQFRLSGDGQERVCGNDIVEIAPRSCVVARYPQGSVVERKTPATDSFQAACLLLSPTALRKLLDVPVCRLPAQSLWIAQEGSREFRSTALPLNAAMGTAVNDIFSCRYRGIARRSFMRAKALELLANVFHSLSISAPQRDRAETLSSRDRCKVQDAHNFIQQELESSLTLAALARRVGLNRTKLAFGFKQLYGVSVQAYWRDERLRLARQLLQHTDRRVTDVAFSIGYSEVSSFARAFYRKFGISPSTIRACD
jgi:AraC-like DNA-binding protein